MSSWCSSIFCCIKSDDKHKLTVLDVDENDWSSEEESYRIIEDNHETNNSQYQVPLLSVEDQEVNAPEESVPRAHVVEMTLEDKQCAMLRRALKKQGYSIPGDLTDEFMIRRYYIGCKGHMNKSLKSLKETIEWRKQESINLFPFLFTGNVNNDPLIKKSEDFMQFQNSTGKCYVRGYDKEGRATIVMHPNNENSKGADSLLHLVYIIERAIACTRRRTYGSQDSVNFIVMFKGFSSDRAPPLSTGKEMIKTLQRHYPERLNRAYLVGTSGFINVLWKLGKPFIDPVTVAKIIFIPGSKAVQVLNEDYEMDQIESILGGNAERQFDSEEYLTSPFHTAFGEMDVRGIAVKESKVSYDDDDFFDAFSRHSLSTSRSSQVIT